MDNDAIQRLAVQLGGQHGPLRSYFPSPFGYGARVYNNAAIAIADNTTVALTFNSERFDTQDFHSTSVNTGRLTVPLPGYYLIGANIQFPPAANGRRAVSLRLNGTNTIAFQEVPGSAVANARLSVTTIYQLVAGEYAEVTVVQNSGAPLNVDAVGNFSPEFWIWKLL